MNTNTKITKAAALEFLRSKLANDPVWARAALLRIYENQTADEKSGEEVHYDNGIGFTVHDVRLMTRFAEFYKARGFLSPKQMIWVFKKIPKYAGQLLRMDYFNMEKLERAYLASKAATAAAVA